MLMLRPLVDWLAPSIRLALLTGAAALPVGAVQAATPTAAQALQLAPVQGDVPFTQPTAAEVAKCTIAAEKNDGRTGWAVRDEANRLLRRFLDTNGDNVVDQWCYYQNGLEVYRDIDSNYNGKADQYRWLNTAGTRWGLDRNEDGKVDAWKAISAEEVSSEVVAALRDGDPARFARLLLTADELKSLGVGKQRAGQLADKLTAAQREFATIARSQKSLTDQTRWVDFGATRPGVVPAGTDDSTADLLVYENALAMTDTGGKFEQIEIGTLVRAGDCWRLIDAPRLVGDAQTSTSQGFFFQASLPQRSGSAPAGPDTAGLSKEAQELLSQLETVDESLAKVTSVPQQEKLNARRIDLLEQLVEQAEASENRENWIRQLADAVSVAVQTGADDDGMKRLEKLHQRLATDKSSKDLAAYVRFRYLTAEYGHALQQPKANYAKIQGDWIKSLKEFAEAYPDSADTAEAMLQLAFAQEHAGEEEDAIEIYGTVASKFPQSAWAKKAAGAQRRLRSVGKPLELVATTIDGRTLDVSKLKGRVVLVHYWASWSEPCKTDIATLKQLQAKYAKDDFAIVGVALDSDRQELISFLREERLPWPNIYEEGGLDSRPANEMGILTLPTMLLVDKRGRVIDRNMHASGLDEELKKQLR